MTLNELIDQARASKCSDLHLTAGAPVAIRRYGELRTLNVSPTLKETEDMIFSILKDKDIEYVKAGNDLDVAYADNAGRVRVNVYHQRNNLAASIRLLDPYIPTFDELGMPDVLLNLANKRSGLILVTGPTGSGKSTTLASLIDYINKHQAKHIITIEDPIEYVYKYDKSFVHQREVGRDVPDFATALRSALREDPDVIMVGEMRDFETINAAINAAETGHLVLSTLHTKSAAQTVDRVISACPSEIQTSMVSRFASVLNAVITQDLVPRSQEDGRICATEVMLNNNSISNLIREGKYNQIPSAMHAGLGQGMHSLNYSLAQLYRMGMIDREEAILHSNNPSELLNMI
ncbi:MAG: type IV pilus twitching motility protein PilT [Lachnospiraceae bacterium]|nr:type IV pilus twitching motility protein PilT [Lachnospiraceae bacterium]